MAKKEQNIVRRRLIRSYITSVISISLVLTMVGAAAMFWVSAGNVASYFKENMAVSLILKQHVEEADARAFADSLAKAPDVRSAEYISRERGEEELEALLGEDFLSVFESTPVPVSVEMRLDGSMISKDSLALIRARLMEDDRVEEVVYQESTVEALNANVKKIALVLSVFIVVLLVISSALINNTVRLNIYARRFTIHTMRLVGARSSFISRPFVSQALIQGAVAGILADLILLAALLWVRSSSELLYSLFDKTMVACVMVGLVLLGMLICSLSALLVTRKISYSSKDDLYY
ncbi:MAG: permease-like cell division protein FtsX [Bacteroidales bacterium]|nr:permease-like cell division protein FtsX [Bacteroidales bacterium]